jgi:Uma2 family endonuclease
VTSQTGRLTYEEYINGPEIRARYDIVDGEMIFLHSPVQQNQVMRQLILRQAFRVLDTFVVTHRLGEALFAPLDVLIQKEPLLTCQPDLIFVSNERRDILGQVVEGGPDLVVEILSRDKTRADVEDKLADYLQLRVRECWLTSPEGCIVEILTFADGKEQRLGFYGVGDIVRSEVLEGLELEVSQIFV